MKIEKAITNCWNDFRYMYLVDPKYIDYFDKFGNIISSKCCTFNNDQSITGSWKTAVPITRSNMYIMQFSEAVKLKDIIALEDDLLKYICSRAMLYFNTEEDYVLWKLKYGL
mgnify:FL=1